jgi:hypothetical protein
MEHGVDPGRANRHPCDLEPRIRDHLQVINPLFSNRSSSCAITSRFSGST